ncbi:MAG: endonuclease III domain-containing protein [Anaeroplasmataceae bacterium]
MMDADINQLIKIITPIGLAKTKSNNLKELSKDLVNLFDSVVPNNLESLTKLKGVGRKTANVVLAIGFNIPALPVDTHVSRVSKILGLSNESDTVEKIENTLMNLYDKDKWIEIHHLLLFFGRYTCLAKSPKCDICPLTSYCLIKKRT